MLSTFPLSSPLILPPLLSFSSFCSFLLTLTKCLFWPIAQFYKVEIFKLQLDANALNWAALPPSCSFFLFFFATYHKKCWKLNEKKLKLTLRRQRQTHLRVSWNAWKWDSECHTNLFTANLCMSTYIYNVNSCLCMVSILAWIFDLVLVLFI